MKIIKKVISLLLTLILALSLVSCGGNDVTSESDTAAKPSEPKPLDTTNIELDTLIPEIINPLTGLEGNYKTEGQRPIAVMLNNIREALPQIGIGSADILFECRAEGGITRLLGFFSEYKDLGVVGSVRSSRPYYIDFAQMFDAIYCHAGGSEDAYAELASRRINHIDGVGRGLGDPLDVYYRDQDRLRTMAYEHTMMTTGQGIVDTIAHHNFRTDLREGFSFPWQFAEYDQTVTVGKNESNHIYIPVSNYQTVDYIYDSETSLYSRYQYNMQKHIDGETGEQLTFTNVIVLFCDTAIYDSYGRLRVTTTGNGSGYLASGGTYTEIEWSRDSREGNLTLTLKDSGKPITINRGKTMVNICSPDVMNGINMNATDR